MATFKEIRGFKIKSLATDPSSLAEGQIWYNSTSGTLKVSPLNAAAWAAGGTMSTARYSLASAGTTTAALAFCGRASPIYSVTEEYDGSAWTGGGAYPDTLNELGGCGTHTAALGAGGLDPGSPPEVATVAEYNGTAWTAGTSLPTATLGGGLAGITTAALYAGGNVTGSLVNTSYHYNGSWTAGGAMTTVRSLFGVNGVQTAAIVTGGRSTPGTETAINACEEYGGSAWTAGGNYPTVIKQTQPGSAGTQSSQIVAGGSIPAQTTNANTYDGTSYSATTSLATARTGHAAGNNQPDNSAAIMFAGSAPGASATSEVYSEAAVGTKTITTS